MLLLKTPVPVILSRSDSAPPLAFRSLRETCSHFQIRLALWRVRMVLSCFTASLQALAVARHRLSLLLIHSGAGIHFWTLRCERTGSLATSPVCLFENDVPALVLNLLPLLLDVLSGGPSKSRPATLLRKYRRKQPRCGATPNGRWRPGRIGSGWVGVRWSLWAFLAPSRRLGAAASLVPHACSHPRRWAGRGFQGTGARQERGLG